MPQEEQKNDDIYLDTVEFIDCIVDDYDYYSSLLHAMSRAETKVAFNRKVIKKNIDEAWVSIIEQSLPALDAIIRSPSRTIKEEEEILPIELSHNITPRSIVHLAQHSNYIKEVDDRGNIRPSKILNVYRDEDLQTYENKFVNTLIERLFIFIDRRYEKLSQCAHDEDGSKIDLGLDMKINDANIKMSLKIETTAASKASSNGGGEASLWQRVENIIKIVSAYKASTFVKNMNGAKVSPPIMRTNAIMKNTNLRQCLVLWQFIESYDKVGYVIDENEVAGRPKKELTDELYSLLAFQYVVFRYNTTGALGEGLGRRKTSRRSFTPNVVSELSQTTQDDYNFYIPEPSAPKIIYEKAAKRLTAEEVKIKKAVEKALKSEKAYKASLLKSGKNR